MDHSALVDTDAVAMQLLRERRVALMIVTQNDAERIGSLLERIPAGIAQLLSEIYIIDGTADAANCEAALEAARKLDLKNVRAFRTPMKLEYGGTQKIGYVYAIEAEFDFLVMLHGDGLSLVESLPRMIAPFQDEQVDVVLGSRMARPRDALRGGMPIHKWIGNRLLTRFENRMLNVHLSEFHMRCRAFRIARLRQIPFKYGSDNCHFDTEILIQFVAARCKIAEAPVPTQYAEGAHVGAVGYAWDSVKSVVSYRFFKMGLFFNPLLDFDLFESENYFFKKAANSLHQFVLRRGFAAQEQVLDLGAASGYISSAVAKQSTRVTAVDFRRPRDCPGVESLAVDLDGDFDSALGSQRFDTVMALDVIEHLGQPELAVQRIARILRPDGTVLASTANVAFIVTRLMLLLGMFNYGKRGILDYTHTRLFTIHSFQSLFRTYGFEIQGIRGFGPPIRDLISDRWPFSMIDSILSFLARAMPRLFAYNFLLIARRLPLLEELYAATTGDQKDRPETLDSGRPLTGPDRA